MRILVVDDEPDLCEILCFNLGSEGFDTDYAYSAEAALPMLQSDRHYDLLLLDVMMEEMSGFDLVRLIRSQGNETPVIFLTARNAETDMLDGFNSGGDDYVAKPYSFPTLLARIRAVLKRSATQAKQPRLLTYKTLQINLDSKSVAIDGVTLPLTKKEYMILVLLMQHRTQHFSREQIISNVWEDDAYVGDRSVDVHIARLRKKLGPYADTIVNHTGFGYAFFPPKQ